MNPFLLTDSGVQVPNFGTYQEIALIILVGEKCWPLRGAMIHRFGSLRLSGLFGRLDESLAAITGESLKWSLENRKGFFASLATVQVRGLGLSL